MTADILRCIMASAQSDSPNTEIAKWILEDPDIRIPSLLGMTTVLCVWVPGLMDHFVTIVTETKAFATEELGKKVN